MLCSVPGSGDTELSKTNIPAFSKMEQWEGRTGGKRPKGNDDWVKCYGNSRGGREMDTQQNISGEEGLGRPHFHGGVPLPRNLTTCNLGAGCPPSLCDSVNCDLAFLISPMKL